MNRTPLLCLSSAGASVARIGTTYLAAATLLLTLGCAPMLRVGAAEPKASPAQSRETLSQLGVIGASQTAGFGAGVSLGKVLQSGLNFDTRLVEQASVMFFANPLQAGEGQIEFLRKQKATVVIGLDYLFWFGYGRKSFDTRKQHLEKAFGLLETLPGPKFLGDLPNMAGAAEYMLKPSQIPSGEELVTLNGMIRDWAKGRDDVTILPLANLVAKVKAEEPVKIAGVERKLSEKQVFVADRLHASLYGQTLLGQFCLAAIRAALPALPPADVTTNLEQLTEAVERRKLGLPPKHKEGKANGEKEKAAEPKPAGGSPRSKPKG